MATAQSDVAVNSGITLQKRVLTFPEVLAQSVANMAPSAAMALLPLFVFLSAGNGAWLSFGISIIVLLIVAYCASLFATRINSAGSFYVWVTRALGPGAGSAAGWGLVLGYLFTGIACVLGFEIYGDNLLVGFGLVAGQPRRCGPSSTWWAAWPRRSWRCRTSRSRSGWRSSSSPSR